MRKMMLVLAGFVAAIVLMAAVLVWPTRYRYDEVQSGQGKVLVRTDRVAGDVQRLNPRIGWVPTAAPAQTLPATPCDLEQGTPYAEAFRGLGGDCAPAPETHQKAGP